jgi:hypothetical protein
MALSSSSVPASLRKPMDNVRFTGAFPPSANKPYLIVPTNSRLEPRVDAKTASTLKARFVSLPQEPEDARLTGVTRSLNRRLLGLNLRGSLNPSGTPGLTA